jgi:hypothetical protein
MNSLSAGADRNIAASKGAYLAARAMPHANKTVLK